MRNIAKFSLALVPLYQ